MKKHLTAPYFKKESFGAVDGPGVRFVLFLQGCMLRCKYCHNPESWKMAKSDDSKQKYISVDEVIVDFRANEGFYANGGLTISGGEPLLHFDFIIELAKRCNLEKIHLCIDTCGFLFNKLNMSKFDELINYINLWLIDIKHINPEKEINVTGVSLQNELEFVRYLEKKEKDYWVRQVLVPNLTDDHDDLVNLGKFISNLKYMSKFELLPYHSYGVEKYRNLGILYPLEGTLPPTSQEVEKAMAAIRLGMKEAKHA